MLDHFRLLPLQMPRLVTYITSQANHTLQVIAITLHGGYVTTC